MYLSNKHKFLYIQIKKTASKSMLQYFKENTKDRVFNINLGDNPHKSILEIKKYLIDCGNYWFKLEDYFIFTFVRNPYDRIVSLYTYLKKYKQYNFLLKNINTFDEFLDSLKNNPFFKGLPLVRRQVDYIKDENNSFVTNFIGKFENLESDWNKLTKTLNLPQQKLPHLNKSNNIHYSKYYNNYSKKLVSQIFVDDINYFKYTF